MGIITNKRKAILKKMLKKYEDNFKKSAEKGNNNTFQCEVLENYKKVRIEK